MLNKKNYIVLLSTITSNKGFLWLWILFLFVKIAASWHNLAYPYRILPQSYVLILLGYILYCVIVFNFSWKCIFKGDLYVWTFKIITTFFAMKNHKQTIKQICYFKCSVRSIPCLEEKFHIYIFRNLFTNEKFEIIACPVDHLSM